MGSASSNQAAAIQVDNGLPAGKHGQGLEPGEGERRLMQAVLSDAIVCLTGRTGRIRERLSLAAEAMRWVQSTDTTWPFSFESICDVLGLDADVMRRRLLRHAAASPLGDVYSGSRETHPLRVLTLLRMRGNESATRVRGTRSRAR